MQSIINNLTIVISNEIEFLINILHHFVHLYAYKELYQCICGTAVCIMMIE